MTCCTPQPDRLSTSTTAWRKQALVTAYQEAGPPIWNVTHAYLGGRMPMSPPLLRSSRRRRSSASMCASLACRSCMAGKLAMTWSQQCSSGSVHVTVC